MIAKLNKGTGFGGLVNYANDIKQKDTNIIASDGVSLTNNKTIAMSFKLQAYGNPKVKKYVGHAMLSFSPKDKPLLTDAYVERIAKDYLQRMGIVNTQFVIFRHHDQPHDHVHIVYNRVDNDGNEITTDTNFRKSAAITQALTREYGLTFGRGKTNVRRDRLKGKDAVKYRIYDIATNLLHHNEYVSLKEFAKDLSEHDITLTGRKNDKGKTVGIIFTMDGMSFAGGKIDKSFTGTNSLLPQSSLSSVTFNDGSTAAASCDSGIASRIVDAAVELVLQPDLSPTPSVGGGSGNNRDDDDDEKKRKSKNKNQPMQRTGRRR